MTVLPKRIDIRVAHCMKAREAIAGGVITPGDLIMIDANDEVVVHGTADGHAAKKFAMQDLYSDPPGGIDDAYAADDTVSYVDAEAGDMIYARLAASQTIVIGDRLVSAGNGQLRKVNVTPATSLTIIAIAREAVTTGVGVVSRIQVEVI